MNKWEMKLTASALPAFSLWKKYQSIMWRHFFNNFILVGSVNSFSSSLIFLIGFFKLSKYSSLVFLAL